MHPHQMEVPRLGLELELQRPDYATAIATRDLSCICNLYHSLQKQGILSPLSEARDQTRILMDTSQFVTAEPCQELQNFFQNNYKVQNRIVYLLVV